LVRELSPGSRFAGEFPNHSRAGHWDSAKSGKIQFPHEQEKVEEMFMSCSPKSNPLPTFSSHLGKEVKADVGRAANLPDRSDQLKNLKYNGQKRQKHQRGLINPFFFCL
jgi:hypothetical protein